MKENIMTFFPAEFTAVAQWMACTIFILSDKKRIKGWKGAALIILALPVMMLLNLAHVDQPPLLWICFTLLGLLAMQAYLKLGTKRNIRTTAMWWCHAVMQSEFAAALAWLVNGVFISKNVIGFPDISVSHTIMILTYTLVFIPLGYSVYRCEYHRESTIKRSAKELAASVTITMGAYTLSNISFIMPDSIFGTSIGGGVLLIRTICDLSGMLALYAYEEFRYTLHLNSNLKNLQQLFERQYEQYQQFRVNHETMQQVYHDLKHQINYIRNEKNLEAREEEINHLESIVQDYEAQYETGNTVLNVLLTSKEMLCRSNGITMECFVDAQQMSFMDPIHICSIFGNAIDNAIEYESQVNDIEKRLIKISVFSENHFLMIHISNYCEQTILHSSNDPETTKANPAMHGFGIKGIRMAAEQYNGHMTLKQENKWFIVSVLIPIPEEAA